MPSPKSQMAKKPEHGLSSFMATPIRKQWGAGNYTDDPEPPWGKSARNGTQSASPAKSKPSSTRNRRTPTTTNSPVGSTASSECD